MGLFSRKPKVPAGYTVRAKSPDGTIDATEPLYNHTTGKLIGYNVAIIQPNGQISISQSWLYPEQGAATGLPKKADPPTATAVNFSPSAQLTAFEKDGDSQKTQTGGHSTAKLAHQEMVFSYGGQTNVTKNVFTDGSVTYVKDGRVLGREAAGSQPATPVTVTSGGSNASTGGSGGSNGTPASSTRAVAPHASDHHGPVELATVTDNDGHGYKVAASNVKNFKVGENGDLLERKEDGSGWYVAKTAKTPAGAPSLVSENGNASTAYVHTGTPVSAVSSTTLISEHGEGMNFATDNNAAGQPKKTIDTVSENGQGQSNNSLATPAWTTSIDPKLGGIGGSAIADHGNALATRDSQDGKKIIVQMSDGSYESIDKTSGDVAGAGTWGDSKGGGKAVNGVGASGYTPPPTAADWHTNPNWTVTSEADKAVLAKVAPSINAADVLEVRAGDNNNTLLRMSDGTYKSVNMAGGAVTDAGTWNKDEWAASTYSSDKNTSTIPNEALARGLPGHTPTEAVDSVGTPAAATTSNDTSSTVLTQAPTGTALIDDEYKPAPAVPAWHANPDWQTASADDKANVAKITSQVDSSKILEVRGGNNNNALLRMSDGTYQSVNLANGNVSGAGNWNNSQWSDTKYASTPPPAAASTPPPSSYDAGGTIVSPTAPKPSISEQISKTALTLPAGGHDDATGATGFMSPGSNVHHPGRMLEM